MVEPSIDSTVRLATYNVHGCVGTDERLDPDRVARVIRETGAGIVGLQEVDCLHLLPDGQNQLDRLAERTGLTAISGPTRHHGEGYFGNALLTCHEVVAVHRSDLTVPGREARGVLVVDLRARGERLQVAVTHFGLGSDERRSQMHTLIELLTGRDEARPLVLLGDFNEWWPRAVLLAELHAFFGYTPPVRSFPSRLPVFALDRIWVRPARCVEHLRALNTPSARLASDHLPVMGRLRLPDAPRGRRGRQTAWDKDA